MWICASTISMRCSLPFGSARGRGGCPGRRCLRLRGGRGSCGGERHDEASPRHEAASGHSGFRSHDFLPVSPWVVAATSSVMNARRVTASASRAADRKDSTPRHGRLLHPSSWAERDDRDYAAENYFQGGSPKTGHPISPPGPPHRQKSFL